MKNRMKKAVFFFAVAMLAATQGISAQAEMRQETKAATSSPANPVHHCSKEDGALDTTDWSYVYFGSYPQSEVAGAALTSAITDASYDTNGDTVVNGIRYRRIRKEDTTNYTYFGDSEYRYFKWEPIKWRVLKNDGNALFVMADKGLDCKIYHPHKNAPSEFGGGLQITWEESSLRAWLNADFYQMAFDSSEQEAIVEQMVINDKDPLYPESGDHPSVGNNTKDKIYLLSFAEVTDPSYGFCQYYERESDQGSASRFMMASPYAGAMGSYHVSSDNEVSTFSIWWLRSPNTKNPYSVTCVESGFAWKEDIEEYGTECLVLDRLCVPVLHISLASDCWSLADSENGNGQGNENIKQPETEKPQTPANPKKTSIKGKITAKKKGFLVKWKKQSNITGYQIQYSTNKKFTKKATKTKIVKKASKTNLSVNKLKPGKKYFVRIRTYQTVNGTDFYSKWSNVKNVRPKK